MVDQGTDAGRVFTRIWKRVKYNIPTLWKEQTSKKSDVGLGGLGVPWSPRDPRFAGSNPAEVNGFFSVRKKS